MTTPPDLDGVVGWVVDLMDALGAPGVGLAIALENVFPPLPSEVFLPLAGFAAARGEMSLLAAIIWTTLGSLVGALVLYGLGAVLGRDRLRAIVDRMPLVHLRDVDRAEAWFARHGAKAVFLGRMVPLVRSLISVPAGVERMRLPLFAALTTAGSLLWNTAFVLAGYTLGENWPVVERYAGIASKAVLALLVLAVVGFVAKRLARRTRQAAPVRSTESPTELIPAARPRPGAPAERGTEGHARPGHAAPPRPDTIASAHGAAAPTPPHPADPTAHRRSATPTYQGSHATRTDPAAGAHHDTPAPARPPGARRTHQ